EPDESLFVKLSNARNATIADGTGVVTILDDGDAKPGISISDASAVEGDVLTFTVTLSMPSTETVTVDYYDSLGSHTLTFAPGQTSKTISLGTVDDSVYEPQSARVILFNVSSNARILDGEGCGTVFDNDYDPAFVGYLYFMGTWYNPTTSYPEIANLGYSY